MTTSQLQPVMPDLDLDLDDDIPFAHIFPPNSDRALCGSREESHGGIPCREVASCRCVVCPTCEAIRHIEWPEVTLI